MRNMWKIIFFSVQFRLFRFFPTFYKFLAFVAFFSFFNFLSTTTKKWNINRWASLAQWLCHGIRNQRGSTSECESRVKLFFLFKRGVESTLFFEKKWVPEKGTTFKKYFFPKNVDFVTQNAKYVENYMVFC